MKTIDAITAQLASSRSFYHSGIAVFLGFCSLYFLSYTNLLSEWFSAGSLPLLAVAIGVGLGLIFVHLSVTEGPTGIEAAARGAFVFSIALFVISNLVPVWLDTEPWVGVRVWWTILSVLLVVVYWSTSSHTKTTRNLPERPSSQHLRNAAHRATDKCITQMKTTVSGDASGVTYGLIAVIMVAAFVRFYRLGALGLAVDEIYTGMAVSGVRESGVPAFPDGTIYHRGLLHIYTSYIASLVFGPGEFSIRLPAAIASLLIVPLLFVIVRDYTGEGSFGLIAAASWALFPWAIEFARWGRYYATSSLLFVATFYTAYVGFKKNKASFVVASVFLSVFAVANAVIGFVSPLIIGTAFILWWFDHRQYTVQQTLAAGCLFASIIPVFKLGRHLFETGLSGSLTVLISSYDFVFTSLNEFDPYFASSFHSEFALVMIAFLMLPLGVATYDRVDSRETVFLTIFGYLPLIILSYYHLHRAPRYLFFFTPLFICGAIIGLARISIFLRTIIELPESSSQRVALAIVLLVCATGIASATTTTDIVTREYGDEYPNQYFAPSPVHDTYEDAKSPMEYVSTHADETATVVTNHEPWYYYYAGEEPDYVIDPGSGGFTEKEPIGYMSETVPVGTPQQLAQVVESSEGPVWFALALSLGYDETNEEIEQYVMSLEPEYQVKLVYGNQTSGPRVYKIDKE